MSQDVIEIVRNLDYDKLENQFALQCAPLIMRLRISNLFIVNISSMRKLHNLLKGTGLSYYVIYVDGQKATVLLFEKSSLQDYILTSRVQKLLREMGYESNDLIKIISIFQKRYKEYREGKSDFPHELGLILAYPIEDVNEYIKYDGKNALYTGYWKVYSNLEEKLELFDEFEKSKEKIINMLNEGLNMREILCLYADEKAA